jgi:CheY-like chemotaxis protein
MEEIKILMVDDDPVQCDQAKQLLNNEVISGKKIIFESIQDFGRATELLLERDIDILILDLKGNGLSDEGLPLGESVLNEIKKKCFVPIIFYTGFPGQIQSQESELIRVVNKGLSVSALKTEIESVMASKLPFIKKSLNDYIRETLRLYLWDFVHEEWQSLSQITDGVSLNYLLARRLAHSLSKERIMTLVGSGPINEDIAHPMEFYVYPPVRQQISTGDILRKDGKIFVILNPACDLILRSGIRKAKDIILAEGISLEETSEYKKYKESRTAGPKKELTKLLENNADENRDRFFLLPKTKFIENTIIDFLKIKVIPETELTGFEIVAELDSPFAESVLSRFVKYYNRIGVPDIKSEDLLAEIDRNLDSENDT